MMFGNSRPIQSSWHDVMVLSMTVALSMVDVRCALGFGGLYVLSCWSRMPWITQGMLGLVVVLGSCLFLDVACFGSRSMLLVMTLSFLLLMLCCKEKGCKKIIPCRIVLEHPHDGTCLGVSHEGLPVVLRDLDANLHTLMVGTTGSGKTTAIANVIESAVLRHLPLFYVDGKGDMELAACVERYAKSHGVPFYKFSMVGKSLHYNPLAQGGYTSKKDRLIELRHWSEDHYRKIAEGYLQTVLKILEKSNRSVDLVSVANYLDPKNLYKLARQHKDEAMARQIDALSLKRRDIESLIAEIENMAQSEIGHLFDTRNHETLILKDAFDERAIVYFCLQPLAFPAYASTLGKLIINDIKQLVSRQLLEEKRETLFAVFDEFSVFAGDQIINLINQGRSAGVHAVLATQSLSDIARQGGQALVGQVLNNCNNFLIQRQNNPNDADVLSNIIGTQFHWQQSMHVPSDTQQQSVSLKLEREPMIHPDDIKRLERGEGLLVKKQSFCVEHVKIRQGAIL